jgi:hypothetical protein
MPLYSIVQRWTSRPIALVEAPTFAAALEQAVKHSVGLLYADLRGSCLAGLSLGGADLRGAELSDCDVSAADLQGADLRTARFIRAHLECASLRGADLRQADLREADLRRADLAGSWLAGADLRGAVFQGARLKDACLDWRWSGLPLELLRQHPEAARAGSKVVAELAFAADTRPFAWLKLLLRHGLAADWVLSVFAGHLRPGDNAPELLRRLAADVGPRASDPRLADPPMLWTRHGRSSPPRVSHQPA